MSDMRDDEDRLPGGASRSEAEELAREMAEVRKRIARTPASTIVANHAMGLYELAAIHLGNEQPRFDDASLAIDAMAALVERLAGRLGDEEGTLKDSLNQLRLAFVTLKDRAADATPQYSACTFPPLLWFPACGSLVERSANDLRQGQFEDVGGTRVFE